jgi:hypothetical protein
VIQESLRDVLRDHLLEVKFGLRPSRSNPGFLAVDINKDTLSKLSTHFPDMYNSSYLADLVSQGGGVDSLGYKMIYADGPNGMEDNTWWGQIWWEDKRKGLDVRLEQDLATERDPDTGGLRFTKPLWWVLKISFGQAGTFGLGSSAYKLPEKKLKRSLKSRASVVKPYVITALKAFLNR